MPVIDASLYITLINAHEERHASCWRWFERVQEEGSKVSSPVILLAEVAAAISRGVGDPALAHKVLEQLKHSRVIELIPVTSTLAERAAIIAADHHIRGCDAVYVALAYELKEPLVTLDIQQLERVAAIVDVHEP